MHLTTLINIFMLTLTQSCSYFNQSVFAVFKQHQKTCYRRTSLINIGTTHYLSRQIIVKSQSFMLFNQNLFQ